MQLLKSFMSKAGLLALLTVGNLGFAFAQEHIQTTIEYTTELEYNLKNKMNWVNLLSIETDIPTESLRLWKNGTFNIQFISIYKTSKTRIANDLQIFSNIEEDNQFFNPFILGYTQQIGSVALFAGLRNVNQDYFTNPYTRLFTNSSCGIYPTVSANYPLANYPRSAMCLHTQYSTTHWMVKNSLYNGIAYQPYQRHTSVFSFRPAKDGVFTINEINYQTKTKNNGIYTLGSALRIPGNPPATQGTEMSQTSKKVNYSLWCAAEQAIYHKNGREIGLLLQASVAPLSENSCTNYYGYGFIFQGFINRKRQDTFGVFTNRAQYTGGIERTAELTWSYPVTSYLDIQPTFHFIHTLKTNYCIGLFRVRLTLST